MSELYNGPVRKLARRRKDRDFEEWVLHNGSDLQILMEEFFRAGCRLTPTAIVAVGETDVQTSGFKKVAYDLDAYRESLFLNGIRYEGAYIYPTMDMALEHGGFVCEGETEEELLLDGMRQIIESRDQQSLDTTLI